MDRRPRFVGEFAVLAALLITASPADGQTRAEGPWWPHPRWGAADQAGASNWITPEKVLEAISLVRSGKLYELGHVYEQSMPLSGGRTYTLLIPGFPAIGPVGQDRIVFNDDFIAGQIGQVGTQFDGIGHVGRRMSMADGTTKDIYYNGFTGEELHNAYGLQRLGIEHVKPIITRGILIDLAGYKGVERVEERYLVTVDDVRNALARQGMSEGDLRPGDALLFNFGWWRLWPDPSVLALGRHPGISAEVAAWIIARNPSMVGSDLALDGPVLVAHPELVMKHGIPMLELMTFEGLLADGVSEFLFIVTPIRFKGATGSPVRPIAIR
jgi:kynurenine formamidase